MKRISSLLLAFVFPALALSAAEPPLSLERAIFLALQHSKGATLSQLKRSEADASATGAKALRYPQVQAFGAAQYTFRPLDLTLRQGSLTPYLDALGTSLGFGPLSQSTGPFPSNDLTLVHGRHTEFVGGLMILQPLSQQWRIGSGVRAADAERSAAQRELEHTSVQIRLGVEQIFAGLILSERRLAEGRARVSYAEHQLHDAENAQQVGELLDDSVLGLRAALMEAKADVTRSDQQRARLLLQLADLIGWPAAADISIVPSLPERSPRDLPYWLSKVKNNPELLVAVSIVDKAKAGVRASRQARIPELSAFAIGYAQDGFPIIPERGGSVGLSLTWDVFDFGRKRAEISKSAVQQRLAETNRDRLEQEAARQIRESYQDFTYAEELILLATQATSYRQRAAELARQNVGQGLALETKAFAAEADLRKAELDLAGARLQRHLALLKLYSLVGE